MQPITKQDVENKLSERVFPAFVIQAFNECICESKMEGSNEVKQDRVIEKILELAPEGTQRNQVFNEHWLDVEKTFEKVGWTVRYIKPAYYEDWKAYFIFS